MKKHEDSLLPEDWKKVARKDWERIKRNLRDNDPEAAGFYLQQSVEKYLKAFLLQHGWELRKIHALHDLLSDAVVFNPSLESFRRLCESVSGYYFADRYPPLGALELTCEDIEKALREAETFIKTMFPEEKFEY
jgi:HEPN domain-containing protein